MKPGRAEINDDDGRGPADSTLSRGHGGPHANPSGSDRMSEASRTSVWPRRWVRSFAGAALATGLAGSLAAQDPPKLPDPPKLDLPKAPEAPKTGTKDVKEDRPAAKERMISFRKSGERWDAVLEWYANESGL
jgi:hypothetical protein